MKKLLGSSAGLCLVFTGLVSIGSSNLAAQDQGSMAGPPRILQIVMEVLKPGQGGNPHIKTESAFVQALTDAKWPTHYFGMDALTGPSRALFFTPYDSFEAWQKDLDAMMKNSTLSAAIDSASVADGALLTGLQTSVYLYREDLSLRAPVEISHLRYWDITLFRLKPGHEKDFEDLAKMYMAAFQKVPNAHWATFEKTYGTDSGTWFIIVTPMNSLAEVDQSLRDGKTFDSSVSEEQKKKMRELTAECFEGIESNLYATNPKMSYPPDSWLKGDPTFWGQK